MDSMMLISPPFTLSPSLLSVSKLEFSSNSAADGLISSQTVRHICTNLLILSEYFGGISAYYPLVIFLQSEGKSLALKGTFNVQSSQTKHPKDQISHLLPYFSPDQTSGLVQYGVPVCVEQNPSSATFETLRSPNFATPFTKKILALLISLWMTLFLCKLLRPCRISKATFHMNFYSKPSPQEFYLSMILFWRSPPQAYYIRTHNSWVSVLKKEPSYLMTVGMSIDARRRTSLRAPSFYFWLRRFKETVFRAQRESLSRFLTSFTFPKLPEPSSLRTSRSFMANCEFPSILSLEEYYMPNQLQINLFYLPSIVRNPYLSKCPQSKRVRICAFDDIQMQCVCMRDR